MRYALVAWSWSGIVWAAIFIAAWAGHITPLEGIIPADGNRLAFTFGDPNYASWFWDSTIFVVYASRTPGKRWMRFVGYGMLVWALVLTESNGGVLALGVGITFLLMVRNYRRHGWAGAIATGLIIGLAVGTFFTVLPLNKIRSWAANSNQALLVNSIGRSAQSSNERGLLIQETWELYQSSDGVLGLGPMSTKPLLARVVLPLLQRGARRLARGAGRARRGRPVRAAAPRRLRRRTSRAGSPAATVGTDGRRRAKPGGHRGRHTRGERQFVLRRGPALPVAVAAVRDHGRARPGRVADASGQPATPVRPAAPDDPDPADHPAAGQGTRRRSRRGGEHPPSARTLHPVGSLGCPRDRSVQLAVYIQAGPIQSGRAGRRPGLRLRSQPAGRPGRRPNRPRLLRTAPGAALAVRRPDLLRPADRFGVLPRGRARQGPANAAHRRGCGRRQRRDQRAGLAGLLGPVPAGVLQADAARAGPGHDPSRWSPR